MQSEYGNKFTVEERKQFIAEAIEELRKAKGISQKEAAAAIGVTQATYSTYERGRTEPPVEILVRMSYLFDCPVDILVQRNRLYRDASEALKQAEQYRAEIAQIEAALMEQDGNNETAKAMLELLGKLNEALAQTAQNAINKPVQQD